MACLAKVLYPPPSKNGLAEWAYAHQEHHDAIEAGIASRFGETPVQYRLFPIFTADLATWLAEHVAAHTRMRQFLQFGGQDLGDWDMKDRTKSDAWLWTNYVDHLAAAQRLGTSIT